MILKRSQTVVEISQTFMNHFIGIRKIFKVKTGRDRVNLQDNPEIEKQILKTLLEFLILFEVAVNNFVLNCM